MLILEGKNGGWRWVEGVGVGLDFKGFGGKKLALFLGGFGGNLVVSFGGREG